MLSDFFRYGMNTSCCRAKILVEYFGEDCGHDKCLMCDVCVNGPPVMQNLKEEENILMQVIATYSVSVVASLPVPCGFIFLFTCESMHNSIISSLDVIVMGQV
ncbi:hypothetical protein Pint_19808 [Pistacia integerrima]|uniref:Uncharacterized protein n=1 Tax=Pistacia integerrima TaxID=434235 RepID=A0ACC0XB52_9ROSI|nr:hypothetical protein Pint_19808 [Pistacia integerrima]